MTRKVEECINENVIQHLRYPIDLCTWTQLFAGSPVDKTVLAGKNCKSKNVSLFLFLSVLHSLEFNYIGKVIMQFCTTFDQTQIFTHIV